MALYGRTFSSSNSTGSSIKYKIDNKINSVGCKLSDYSKLYSSTRNNISEVEDLEFELELKLPILIVGYPKKEPYMFREPKGAMVSVFKKGKISDLITACNFDSARDIVNQRYGDRGLTSISYKMKDTQPDDNYRGKGMTLQELLNYFTQLNPSDPIISKLNRIIEKRGVEIPGSSISDKVLGLTIIPESQIDSQTGIPMSPGLAYEINLKKSVRGGKMQIKKSKDKTKKSKGKTKRSKDKTKRSKGKPKK